MILSRVSPAGQRRTLVSRRLLARPFWASSSPPEVFIAELRLLGPPRCCILLYLLMRAVLVDIVHTHEYILVIPPPYTVPCFMSLFCWYRIRYIRRAYCHFPIGLAKFSTFFFLYCVDIPLFVHVQLLDALVSNRRQSPSRSHFHF